MEININKTLKHGTKHEQTLKHGTKHKAKHQNMELNINKY